MKKATIILTALVSACAVTFLCVFFCFYMPKKQEEDERARLVAEYYAAKLERFAAENESYADGEVDAAFLGDSLTDGYDLAAYYPQFLTANRGIGGENTFGLEKRLAVSAYELKPKVVLLLIGGNNLQTMFDNYENILKGLKDNLPDSKVILLSLTAMGGRFADKNPTVALNNVRIRMLAEQYGFAFVDLFSPLYDPEAGEIRASFTVDGAHLSPEGYRVVTDAITPRLAEALNGAADETTK